MEGLDRSAAEAYASWFRCVADPTRLQVLHLLASRMTPLRVGEIARTVGVAQSTASVHLRRLLDDEFVIVERSANSSWYRINAECLEQFPRAAAQVMGTLAGTATTPDALAAAPWQRRTDEPGEQA